MKLTLLGTGCPSVDFKRCGSSNLISTKSTKILVDCGSGVTQRLDQSKNSSADIDALLLTHLHTCLLYTSPSPRDRQKSRMPSSA